MQNLRKSVFGAILGVSLAVGLGAGATQLHASITAAEAVDCDSAKVCPVEAAAACPTEKASSCPTSKDASI